MDQTNQVLEVVRPYRVDPALLDEDGYGPVAQSMPGEKTTNLSGSIESRLVLRRASLAGIARSQPQSRFLAV